MKQHSLQEWLNQIMAMHPKTIDLGLQRITKLAERIGLQQFSCPVITVAGTNGKGSCIKAMEAILLAKGKNVACYTSPHLLQFNERIVINGEMCSDETIITAFEAIEAQRGELSLSYFEYVTLAALWLFKQEKLDYILLEVGLGGRLDAVNVVDADVSVITTIAKDHCHWLGEEIEQIAYEKAGIMRPHKPAVYADTNPANSIIDHANTIQANLYCHGRDFSYQLHSDASWDWDCNEVKLVNLPICNLPITSINGALAALYYLDSELLQDQTIIASALAKASLPGRMQENHVCGINCVYDVAHNPQSVSLLVKRLMTKNNSKIIAVMGVLQDKAIAEMLQNIAKHVSTWYLGSLVSERGAKAQQIANKLQDIDANAHFNCYDTVNEAYDKAISTAKSDERVVVFGSFHTVAEVLKEEEFYEVSS